MAGNIDRDSNMHLVPESIHFSLFTTEQIKKLCVTKIITPLMFDSMGHPLPGGLYDSRLGPISDKGDLCRTCYKTRANCPGHFGYIELPVPVVNPLFHKIIGILLKVSCLSCYIIQIPSHIKHSLCIQLKLLKAGLVTSALEVETIISQLIGKYESIGNIPENEIASVLDYEKSADEVISKLGDTSILNMNTEVLHNQFINKLLKDVKLKKFCTYCKARMNRIQVLKNRINMTVEKVSTENSVNSRSIRAYESKYINPMDSRNYLRKIWEANKSFVEEVVSVLKTVDIEYPTDILYFDVIPVPPPSVRPVNYVNGRHVENEQSVAYRAILQSVLLLTDVLVVCTKKGDVNTLMSAEAKEAFSYARGSTPLEKLHYAWEVLQHQVNGLVDRDPQFNAESKGLKQIIEKKEGIIRMNMMGKRVDFAARSVITPDPNLDINEIGVPEEFAKKLTYPVTVTPWNLEKIREMVLNGPNVHPGAVMVEYNGRVQRIKPNDPKQQKDILNFLSMQDKSVKVVHRHLCNGDVLLLNRQPTLHKPSIMAHKARLLKGEKTLRLHYANCKAYNADFDGDEMNAHFPQNELAKSEGLNIVNVSNQYLVPKDGTPLSGLIQDHIISGVRLCIRGKFFSVVDYHQLVYQALSFKTDNIVLLPPAIIVPQQLWSGKQILSTVIINIIPKGKARINLTGSSKISAKAWQSGRPRPWKAGGTPFKNENTMSETEVIIRNGELLAGILDKTHYGATPYGLVHCIYELYGGSYAIRLLSSFARLFTISLQREGFTLSVHDILTVEKADTKRQKIVEQSKAIGVETVAAALDIPSNTPLEEIVEKIEQAEATNPKLRAIIDRQYKMALDGFTNKINKTCLPAGLVCKFPENNLQLMVQSGAKGSTVNTMQISCLLGQIELEGKRPPIMISGKSLPSFPVFEFSPRAGGFIAGRFMTGIQPQEFFFHCMAGREGLIDTAVKTSRSGYLQRCLIKHLEGLQVGYDMTVRNSDNSVIQWRYGEDGLDISKAQFFNEKQLSFLNENKKAIADKELIKELKKEDVQKDVKAHREAVTRWKSVYGDPLKKSRSSPFGRFSQKAKEKARHFAKEDMVKLWQEIGPDSDIKKAFEEMCKPCPDPVDSVYQPDSNFGAINERLEKMINNFQVDKKKSFQDMMKLKTMQSMCSPGEPVGLLAAQSIGEPSTQMTLNTFHFAGRGEMNVTLGIPRLREILMMASKNIKTPSMEIPFLNVPDLEEKANELRKLLTRVVMADVLEKVDVSVDLQWEPKRQYRYTVKFHFLPRKCYSQDYCVTPSMIINHTKRKFFGSLFSAIKKFCKVNSNVVMMMDEKPAKKTASNREDDEGPEEETGGTQGGPGDPELSSDDEVEDEDDAKTMNKFKEAREDQEPEPEEKEVSDEESDEETEAEKLQQKQEQEGTEENSTQGIKTSSSHLSQNYTEDKKKRWCEITFALPLNCKKLDLTHILKDVASKSVVWETPDIRRAITYKKDDNLMLRTDGINIVKMFEYHDLLDLKRLYCNDIHKMAATYGIEAASKIIVKEVKDVFNVYGIKVDPRHLSLIADYMTFNGTFEPLSRKGMESSASPLQQISFESSLIFLKNALIRGKEDTLNNPSSSIMIGKPCKTGTGSFTLLSNRAAFT